MSAVLLTPEQVGRRLSVSSASVRRWIQSGELEAVRLGSGDLARYRISDDALAAFVRPAHDDLEAA